jgi:hypothetical protein
MTGNAYQKRPVAGSPVSPSPPVGQLTGREARELADRIGLVQSRYLVSAIRLLGGGGCGVVVVDQQTAREHILGSAREWDQLAAG